MTRIYLVRHAQAEGNLYRRAHGAYNSLITPQGYAQINALKKRFADIAVDVVYSSPRFRTRVTASAIYGPKDIPMYVMDDLREVDCGPWEDRPWGDIRYYEGEQLDNFNYHFDQWHVDGAETAEQVRERMLRVMNTIVHECPDMTVAAVSHGMASRILLGTLMGMSLKEISENFPHGDNTAVSLIEYENGKYHVVFANDASHLDQTISTFANQTWWKGRGWEEVGLRFASLNLQQDTNAALYQLCGAEAWQSCHNSMEHYDSAAFLEKARCSQKTYPGAVLAAYHGDQFAGLLQLDVEADSADGIGQVCFVYLTPEYRSRGVAIQLVGEMVSRYRSLKRKYIRLQCAKNNQNALDFFVRSGFRKIGETVEDAVDMDILELYIGF